MSWKDDLKKLLEGIDGLHQTLKVNQALIVGNSKRLGVLEGRLKALETNQSRVADRMGDRLIEMAMVQQGGTRDAAIHRRALDEGEPEQNDLWQESPETEWPPKGCDAINLP